MKKTVFSLMLLMSVAFLISSCGKEEEQTEKERVIELLTSGKWYYHKYYKWTCFDNNDYWEFKTDGTFKETWDFGDDTYTISEDGKTITLNYELPCTISNISISESTFRFTITFSEGSPSDVVLAKTVAPACEKEK